MNRREFIGTIGGYAAAAAVLSAASSTVRAVAAETKPNIVLIVADDLGYGELGVQGANDIPTPNIDSIAKNGVRFTDGYVTCPVCSPTRAALLTGRYQQRFGHEFNPGPPGTESPKFGLPLTETTLPQRLKSLGYATGMFGKWHLGMKPDQVPTRRGFDEFYGFLGGSHSYLNATIDAKNPVLRGVTPVDAVTYTTDEFAREACAFIDRHKAEPFFVYLPFNAVHAPLDTLEKYIAPFASVQDEKRRKFSAMLAALDAGVGAVLAKLAEVGVRDNTLVVFISDNGGPTTQTTARNTPLRGLKGQVLDGGIRVPFMMQWPGKIPAGAVFSDPACSIDILPTAVAAAGGTIPDSDRIDGVDLMPCLSGKDKSAPHKALFWRNGEQWAVRMGNYKLTTPADAPTGLFDLSKDIHEDHDLSKSMPEKVNELRAAYDEWNAKNVAPLWERPVNRPRSPARSGT